MSAYVEVHGGEYPTLYARVAVDGECWDLQGDAYEKSNGKFYQVIGQCDVTGIVILKDLWDGVEEYVLARNSDLLYFKAVTDG